MRDLKSDIIHAIYQCSGVDNEKLVDVSNICDKFQSRLDAAENNAMDAVADMSQRFFDSNNVNVAGIEILRDFVAFCRNSTSSANVGSFY